MTTLETVENYGFAAGSVLETVNVTVVGVTANGNSQYEILNLEDSLTFVNVINSFACGNGVADVTNVQTAQATTCIVSDPSVIGTFPVCQCLC
jgi:hypothetical protein